MQEEINMLFLYKKMFLKQIFTSRPLNGISGKGLDKV